MAEVAKKPGAHAPGACWDTSCWIRSACHLQPQPALRCAALTFGIAIKSNCKSCAGPRWTPPGLLEFKAAERSLTRTGRIYFPPGELVAVISLGGGSYFSG